MSPGLQVSDSARLEVRDNLFLNVESASIDVVNVDHVEVVGNAFSQNAIKVPFPALKTKTVTSLYPRQAISTSGVSSLFISCNRLTNEHIKPECLGLTTTPVPSTTVERKTTSAAATTTMMATSFAKTSTSSLLHVRERVEEGGDGGEVVVGVLSGLLLVLLVLLLGVAVLCAGRWGEGVRAELLNLYTVKVGGRQKEEVVEEKEVLTAPAAPPPPPPPPPPAAPLTQISPTSVQPQLFTPIWMEEIQKNKIFAKQRLIMQDSTESEKLVQDTSMEDIVEVSGEKLEEAKEPSDGEMGKKEESPLPESDQVGRVLISNVKTKILNPRC